MDFETIEDSRGPLRVSLDDTTLQIRPSRAGFTTPSTGVSSLRPLGDTTDRRGRRRRLPAPSAEYQQDVSTRLGALELEVALDDVLSKQILERHRATDAAPHRVAAGKYQRIPSHDNGDGPPLAPLPRAPVSRSKVPDVEDRQARTTDHMQYWSPSGWHGPAGAPRSSTSFMQASVPRRLQDQHPYCSARNDINPYSSFNTHVAEVSDTRGPRVQSRTSCIRSTARLSYEDALLRLGSPDGWDN